MFGKVDMVLIFMGVFFVARPHRFIKQSRLTLWTEKRVLVVRSF
jgi:hypothetical protein